MRDILCECLEVSVSTLPALEALTYVTSLHSILVTCAISFLARALSSIKEEMFCWTAISSAGIVGILPGFLIRESAVALVFYSVLKLLQCPAL